MHQERTEDQVQGRPEAGDQTQTPVLPGENDICDDGEHLPVQGAGVLPAPQTAEHQEPGEMVPHLEGQTQGLRSLNLPLDGRRRGTRRRRDHQRDCFHGVHGVTCPPLSPARDLSSTVKI